jgi:hypothetical protein
VNVRETVTRAVASHQLGGNAGDKVDGALNGTARVVRESAQRYGEYLV